MEEKTAKDKKEKEEKEKKENKDGKDKKSPEIKKDTTLVINWDGLKDRKARLTIHSSTLSDALLSKDGEKLFYLARFEKGLNLWSCELRTKETKMELALNAQSGSLYWDKEMKNIFLLADGRISKIAVDPVKQSPVDFKGEINLDVPAERQQMFNHVWKRTKSMFYISDFHGAPWDDLRIAYEKKLPSIGNGYEFAELLSEMLGELNVSHCGASYRFSDPNGDNTAALGIFVDYDFPGNGIRIAEIIKGGPLDKENIKVTPGMIIEQIDGEIITAQVDAAKFLNRKVDKNTSLLIFDSLTKIRQQITVKPVSLEKENQLIYRRWIRANQDEVDRLSNGQLGYVHIPGMSDGPYRNVYEEVMGKYHDRKGLIIDTRFNGGGDLVSDLAQFFTGKKYIDYAIESRSVGSEPGFRWTKPTVAMVNEANYSDGHCFACGYQDLGIGKLIGMPVPGTCSYAGWEMLWDGSVMWGSVPVSSKNMKGQWLENLETTPEVQIKNEPGVIGKGRDQQLERAVEELMRNLK
jgi:C-terminal processing protease CtpA/Prc